MTAEASATPRSAPPLVSAGAIEWLRSRRGQTVAALAVYLIICIVYFGLPVLGHFASHSVSSTGSGSDPSIFMWSLVWWPHAIGHGLNPFYTTELFAPGRVALGGDALIPGPALLMTPITLLAGPIASYNVIMLASPLLAALCAFLLCRYLTERFLASLVGGYLFGFSAYMLTELFGHTHLVVVFVIPAGVHLTLRLLDGRIIRWRYVVLMGLNGWLMVTTATEVTLSFVGFSAIALIIAVALMPPIRPRVWTALPWIIGAGMLAGVLAAPVLYYALTAGVTGLGDTGPHGADALSLFVPTGLVWFGHHSFNVLSHVFASESEGLYLGLPLILIILRYVSTRWGRPGTRFLTAILVVIAIAALGSYLHIAGYQTISLPWKWIDHSLLNGLVPARFGVYAALVAGVIAALWLAAPRAGGWGIAKWVAAAAAVAALIPNLSEALWHAVPYDPPLFTTNEYRQVLWRNEVVLFLPGDYYVDSMLWQAEAGMWFRQAGGYVNRTFPKGYENDPMWAAFVRRAQPTAAGLRSFIVRRHVGAVILNPTDPQDIAPWIPALTQLGLRGREVGGVTVYLVPPGLSDGRSSRGPGGRASKIRAAAYRSHHAPARHRRSGEQ